MSCRAQTGSNECARKRSPLSRACLLAKGYAQCLPIYRQDRWAVLLHELVGPGSPRSSHRRAIVPAMLDQTGGMRHALVFAAAATSGDVCLIHGVWLPDMALSLVSQHRGNRHSIVRPH